MKKNELYVEIVKQLGDNRLVEFPSDKKIQLSQDKKIVGVRYTNSFYYAVLETEGKEKQTKLNLRVIDRDTLEKVLDTMKGME